MLGTTGARNRLPKGLWSQTSLQDAVSCPTRVGENAWKGVGCDPRQCAYTLLPFPATAAIPSSLLQKGSAVPRSQQSMRLLLPWGQSLAKLGGKKTCLGTRASRCWLLVLLSSFSMTFGNIP